MVISLLKTSLFMSVTIIVLILLTYFLKSPALARWRYICWTGIAFGLLIPIRLPVIAFEQPQALTRVESIVTERIIIPSEVDYNSEGYADMWSEIDRVRREEMTYEPDGEVAANAPKPINISAVLFVVWAAGVMLFITLCVTRHIRFIRHIKRWCYSAADEALPERVRCMVKLRQKAELLICPAVDTPVMIGFFKPVIVLPEDYTDNSALELILAHEMIHYKYGDVWVRVLTLAAWAVHWFNPLMLLMNKFMNKDCEIACDQKVLRCAGAENREKYGEVVLETAFRIAGNRRRMLTAISPAFSNSAKSLKARLASIVDKRGMKRWAAVCCALALVTVTLFSSLLTSCTSPEADNPPYIVDTPVDLTPTNELVIYTPPWSETWLYPAIDRFKEMYPDVNVIIQPFDDPYEYGIQLSAEIAAGKGTDIIFPQFMFDQDDYKAANSGSFFDLNKIIEQDSDFNFDDYIKPVLDSGIYCGRRYIIPMGYSVNVLTSVPEKLDIIGFDRSKMRDTVSFMNEIVRCLPKAQENPNFITMVNDSIWYSLYINSGYSYVDYERGKPLPDEEGLKQLIEAYKPYQPIDSKFNSGGAVVTPDHLLGRMLMFSQDTRMSGFFQLVSELKTHSSFEINVIPDKNGKIHANSQQTAAIRASSPNQLNAWNLIKILLSPEYQGSDFLWFIPAHKDTIIAKAEKLRDIYNGDDTIYTKLSDEELQEYIDLITNIDYAVAYVPSKIEAMFFRHMEPYYKDEKSLKDCISELKNALKLYISE